MVSRKEVGGFRNGDFAFKNLYLIQLLGYIEVKLALIADAYFNDGDFDMRDMLKDAYNQLNSCLEHNFGPSVYVGLPIRDIVLK